VIIRSAAQDKIRKDNTVKHKWKFISYFRSGAYGWKGSRLAAKRVKDAVTEINKVSKTDLAEAATGAVKFMEKIVPAIEHVDDSWGVLGNSIRSAIQAMVEIVTRAAVDGVLEDAEINKIWNAYTEDGYGYLESIGQYWGQICGTQVRAEKWVNILLPLEKERLGDEKVSSYSRGTIPLLSCFLACKRYSELMYYTKSPNLGMWIYQIFGVKALEEQGKIDEAIAYAQECRKELFNAPIFAINEYCEGILLKAGRYEEAYERYGLASGDQQTNLNIYRSILKKYPMISSERIFNDLVTSCGPEYKGKWFATAKSLGKLDLAISLAQQGPTEPKTLNRAAKEYQEKEPDFALKCAMLALRWISEGYGYEIAGADVVEARFMAVDIAAKQGKKDEVLAQIREWSKKNSPFTFLLREV